MIASFVASILRRCDDLIERLPDFVRKIAGPVFAPLGAAARTLLLTITGNVQAIADEPVVTANALAQAVFALQGASIGARLTAAATVLLRQVVRTGVGPNAARGRTNRVGPR